MDRLFPVIRYAEIPSTGEKSALAFGGENGEMGRLGVWGGPRVRILGAVVAFVALGVASAAVSSASSLEDEIFTGDFEVGPPGWQQFGGAQYEYDRPLGESFVLVDSPVRQGRLAGRFTVRHGYSSFGHNEDSEVGAWFGGEKEGDEYWYAWSTLFPPEWEAPYRWGIFTQWHAKLDTSPILSFGARADTATFNLLSGLTDNDRNVSAVDRSYPLLTTLSKGRWNDFALHVRWTANNAGLVEVYHRVAGTPTMRRLVKVEGVPTFQFTREGRGIGTYLLHGLYRGSLCPQPTQPSCIGTEPAQPTSVLYHDGFTRARSFEAAARHAFPGPLPKLVLTSAPEPGAAPSAAPIRLTSRSASSGRAVDQGCRGCRVIASGNRIAATIAGPGDGRDTAVIVYRVTQRSTVVVRQKLRISGPRPLAGNLTVTQLRRGARVLAEVYVAATDGTLRVFSPAGALTSNGFNVESRIVVHPRSHSTKVELRLARRSLVLVVDGKIRVRQSGIDGPPKGVPLLARIGIDHYDGATGGGVRVTHDDVVVGAG
jgi:hypothetical protein